jgi:nucleotide-binding universal stress UspA family protein
MLHVNKILVPTDFSDGSSIAYHYANDFAKRFGGKIHLLHVIPAFKYFGESIKKLGLPFDMDKDLYPHLLKETKDKAWQDLENYFDEEVQGDVITFVEARISDGILEMAEEEDFDLIIMGAQGANAEGFLHGSVTDKVLRTSNVPVLTVPVNAPEESVRKFLIPIDFSKVSFESVPFTLSMAAQLDGDITLFHVLEIHGSLSENEYRPSGKDEIDSIHDLLLDKLEGFLDDQEGIEAHLERVPYELYDNIIIKDGDEERTVRVFTKVVRGVAAHYLVNDYADENSDMIVMTTHGRSGLSHLLLGSTTEKVVQHSSRPVLTFRPDKHKRT